MAKIEILKVGHALVQGVRGAKGGAPSKDSIWGIAFVQGNLIKFFGRRGGVLRYKTQRRVDLPEALAMFEDKLSGKGQNYQYVDVSNQSQYNELIPGLDALVSTGYYKAMANKKLNTRATQKVSRK